MEDSDLVYELLSLALIYIREQGHDLEVKPVFHIADLFHNMPSHLRQVSRGELTHSEVLALLREKAKQKKCEDWVEGQIAQIAANYEPSEDKPLV